jgi:hypothetical protein
MNIKKIILITLVLLLSVSLLSAATYKKKAPIRHKTIKTFVKETTATFAKGDMFVTPQIGFNSWALPFGVNFEYAVTENIGIGGTVTAYFWSGASVIIPSVNAAYHFTMLEVEKLDLFAGAEVGFAIYNAGEGITGSSGIYISPFVAGRYWFSKKMGVSARLNIGLIGDWAGAGGMFGVVFKL